MVTRKAEMWDKMQYLFRNYYDRMVHVAIKFRGKIDKEALIKSLDILVDRVDILRCNYVPHPMYPHWELNENYDINKAVRVISTDNLDEAIDESLQKYIPAESDFQLRMTIIESGDEGAVTLLVNHMCSDGGDVKYLVSKLTELYADISSGGNGDKVNIKVGRRDSMQVYDRMSPEKARRAKKLYKNITQSTVNVKFPFTVTKDDEEEKVRLYRIRWAGDCIAEFNKARKKAASTVNDVLLAAFFRNLYRYLDGTQEYLNVVSMMDLRRYGETLGVTNMTGFAPCDIHMKDEPFLATLEKVKKRMEQNKADEFMGLYSLPLLKLAFGLFPNFISEMAIRLGYQNPLIGMSNIGILDKEKFSFKGTEPIDAFMTGASKYKPYMQITATTFGESMTFCIAEKCNIRDGYIISQFLTDFIAELETFLKESAEL